MPTRAFDTYSLQVNAGAVGDEIRVIVFCRSPKDLIGWINFYDEGRSLPGASRDSTTKRISLSFSMSQFGPTMDILRKEKPLTLFYISPTVAGLATSIELVGEEDHKTDQAT